MYQQCLTKYKFRFEDLYLRVFSFHFHIILTIVKLVWCPGYQMAASGKFPILELREVWSYHFVTITPEVWSECSNCALSLGYQILILRNFCLALECSNGAFGLGWKSHRQALCLVSACSNCTFSDYSVTLRHFCLGSECSNCALNFWSKCDSEALLPRITT